MYDVKQFDPAEWTSPPLEARIVDKPGVGKVIVGRGAVNQKGPEVGVPRGAARHSRRRQEDAGQPRARRRGRRGDRLAAHRPARSSARSGGGAAEDHRRVHALGRAGPRRHRHREPRRQRRRRARARVERREVGPRPGEGHPLLAQGHGRQPGLAAGQGARHARLGRRQHDHRSTATRSRGRSAPKRRR